MERTCIANECFSLAKAKSNYCTVHQPDPSRWNDSEKLDAIEKRLVALEKQSGLEEEEHSSGFGWRARAEKAEKVIELQKSELMKLKAVDDQAVYWQQRAEKAEALCKKRLG